MTVYCLCMTFVCVYYDVYDCVLLCIVLYCSVLSYKFEYYFWFYYYFLKYKEKDAIRILIWNYEIWEIGGCCTNCDTIMYTIAIECNINCSYYLWFDWFEFILIDIRLSINVSITIIYHKIDRIYFKYVIWKLIQFVIFYSILI